MWGGGDGRNSEGGQTIREARASQRKSYRTLPGLPWGVLSDTKLPKRKGALGKAGVDAPEHCQANSSWSSCRTGRCPHSGQPGGGSSLNKGDVRHRRGKVAATGLGHFWSKRCCRPPFRKTRKTSRGVRSAHRYSCACQQRLALFT